MVCASTSQRRQRRCSAQAAAAASQAAVPTTGAAARCRPSYHLHECARQRHEQVRAARELEAAARRPRPGCFRQRGRGPNRRSARHLPSLALPPSPDPPSALVEEQMHDITQAQQIPDPTANE